MHAVLGSSAKRVAATAALAAVVVAGSSLPVQATQSTAKSGVLAQASIGPTRISASNETSTGHPWAGISRPMGGPTATSSRTTFHRARRPGGTLTQDRA